MKASGLGPMSDGERAAADRAAAERAAADRAALMRIADSALAAVERLADVAERIDAKLTTVGEEEQVERHYRPAVNRGLDSPPFVDRNPAGALPPDFED